jgi:hypothetical protein
VASGHTALATFVFEKGNTMSCFMKLFYTAATAAMLATSAHADTLSVKDRSYVVALTAATIVEEKCDVTLINNFPVKLADAIGVDAVALATPVITAYIANANHLPHGRDEATSTYLATALLIHGDLRLDYARTCRIWVGEMRLLGLVQ